MTTGTEAISGNMAAPNNGVIFMQMETTESQAVILQPTLHTIWFNGGKVRSVGDLVGKSKGPKYIARTDPTLIRTFSQLATFQ